MSEYRCPDCSADVSDAALSRTRNCCPSCGIRFGYPRAYMDSDGFMRALDPIKAGELFTFVRAPDSDGEPQAETEVNWDRGQLGH